MRSTLKPPRGARQLTLFRPLRDEPNWEAVPVEIQQQVLRLLAHLLRDHAAHRPGEHAPQEDRDE